MKSYRAPQRFLERPDRAQRICKHDRVEAPFERRESRIVNDGDVEPSDGEPRADEVFAAHHMEHAHSPLQLVDSERRSVGHPEPILNCL